MLVNEMRIGQPSWIGEGPDLHWIAGFLAGLRVIGERHPEWLWKPFCREIRDAGKDLNVEASRFEAFLDESVLGGYISATGSIEGFILSFPVGKEDLDRILRLIPCDYRVSDTDRIEIPITLDALQTLLYDFKVEGPLQEKLEEVVV